MPSRSSRSSPASRTSLNEPTGSASLAIAIRTPPSSGLNPGNSNDWPERPGSCGSQRLFGARDRHETVTNRPQGPHGYAAELRLVTQGACQTVRRTVTETSRVTRGSCTQEREQFGNERLWRFLGYVVAGLDRAAAQVVRPRAPDLERVAVQLLHVVARRPEHEHRALNMSARTTVRVVVRAVDPEPGPVVLHHRVDDLGVADRAQVVRVVLLAHLAAVGPVPGLGIRGDHPLGRLFGLGEEEPVPPGRGEGRVGARERLADRHGVEDGQSGHRARMVERAAERDVRAAVVPHDGEALVPERPHHATQSRAIARFEYGPWSSVVGGLDDSP